MPTLTVLSHGTANSTNTDTSEGSTLVISKIAKCLDGADGTQWILNEGAGTDELTAQGVRTGRIPFFGGTAEGVLGGKGVEGNVRRSVEWILKRLEKNPGNITVNLVGHSRGSITCYKIARALCDNKETSLLRVNIFAIDPVPGNTGHVFTKNGENYKNIILGGNVWQGNSFLLLAESEHRLVFRPYVDALYACGLPQHKFDTIPGTHGGINMLEGREPEAAAIVLSRALDFLAANGSPMKEGAKEYILDGQKRLKRYAQIMLRIGDYKRDASINPIKGGTEAVVNLASALLRTEKHRVANVQHTAGSGPELGRGDFKGKDFRELINTMSRGDGVSMRPCRFFCNLDHQEQFALSYPSIFETVRALERAEPSPNKKAEIRNKLRGEWSAAYVNMRGPQKVYFDSFVQKRGIELPG